METDLVHGQEAARCGSWSWREPHRGEHFRRCSYCGSINPEDLAAEPTWRAAWADRKYGWPHKFYVDIPNRQPDRLFVVGGRYGDSSPGPHSVAWADLTPEQLDIAKRDGWGDDRLQHPAYVDFGTREAHHAKFYTAHLADLQLGAEVKDSIERRSGLRFHFQDGKVRWEAATAQQKE